MSGWGVPYRVFFTFSLKFKGSYISVKEFFDD